MSGIGLARPVGTTGGAALHAVQPEELRDRCRVLSAWLVHHEAQPAPERKGGAASGTGGPSSPSADRPFRRPAPDRYAGALDQDLTGMPAVAMSPAAGAHGELCGLMAARAALEDARRCPAARAGAGLGPRHQPGDGGDLAAIRSTRSRRTIGAGSILRPSRDMARMTMSPRSC